MRPTPYLELATAVAGDFAESVVSSISRFPHGLHHYVFDVTCADGRVLVVRLADPENATYVDAAVYWHAELSPLGVPLPRILARGVYRQHPFLVLERLRGQDLGDVYDVLTFTEGTTPQADRPDRWARVERALFSELAAI